MSKNFFLACVSVLIGIGIVEIGLRLFDPLKLQPHASLNRANVPLVNNRYYCEDGPGKLLPHPLVHQREGPNQSYFEFANDIVSFIDINEHGFRGSFERNDNRKRVVVLGDSFIRGTLADETETIPALLSQWSKDTYFANLGTGGHGTLQHALTYDEFKDQISHETVLMFVFIGNDLVDNLSFQAWQENPERSTFNPTPTQRLKRMVGKFYVGKLLQRIKNMRFDDYLYASVPSEKEQQLLFESLAGLSQAVADRGARLFVFSLPEVSEFIEKGTKTFREDPVGYADAVRSLLAQAAEDHGFTYHNLKTDLVAMSQSMGIPTTALFGNPDFHLQEIGNFAVAGAVARLLQDEGVSDFAPDAEFVDRTHFDPDNVACP